MVNTMTRKNSEKLGFLFFYTSWLQSITQKSQGRYLEVRGWGRTIEDYAYKIAFHALFILLSYATQNT